MALGERQTAERRQRLVDRCPASLEHDRIAELEFEAAQPNRRLLPMPADGQDVDAVALAQMQLRGRMADQIRVGGDHRFDRGEPVGVRFCRHESSIVFRLCTLGLRAFRQLGQLLAADDVEPAINNELFERLRVSLDHEQIIRQDLPAPARDIPPVFVANDSHDRDLAARRVLQFGHHSASERRAGRPRFPSRSARRSA